MYSIEEHYFFFIAAVFFLVAAFAFGLVTTFAFGLAAGFTFDLTVTFAFGLAAAFSTFDGRVFLTTFFLTGIIFTPFISQQRINNHHRNKILLPVQAPYY